MAITQYYFRQAKSIGWLLPKVNFVLQQRKECDKIQMRHNSICLTRQESVHFYFGKNACSFQHTFLCVWSCVAAIGAMRFSVRGFGHALF